MNKITRLIGNRVFGSVEADERIDWTEARGRFH